MTDYELLREQAEAMSDGVAWEITILSNLSALLYESMDELNWAGFYLLRDGALELGPFQGKPACTRIPVGKGVCGTAVLKDEIQRVEDVHAFPGHIACDGASASEIVLPIHVKGQIVGVLDMDSPVLARFTKEDEKGLEGIVKSLERILADLA